MGAQVPLIHSVCQDELCLRLRRVAHAIEIQSTKRRPGIERVHRLRTEIRRIDVSLQLLNDVLPRQDALKMRRRLDRVRRRAGHVRDLDVLRPLLTSGRDRLPDEANEWLLHRLDQQRKQAARDLLDQCRKALSRDMGQQIKAFKRLIHHHHRSDRIDHGAIQNSFRVLISQVFSTAKLATTDLKQLHPLRKSLRNARYAIESIHWHDCNSTAQTVDTELTTFQDLLGEANDQIGLLAFLLRSHESCSVQAFHQPIASLIQRLEQDTPMSAQVAIRRVCRRMVRLTPIFSALIHQFPR